MEENNNQNEINTNERECHEHHHEHHCCKKMLAILLAAFLGGFLANYFVTDQIMERSFAKHNGPFRHDRIERNFFGDFDRMYQDDMKSFDKAFKKMDKKINKDFNKNFNKNFDKNIEKMPPNENMASMPMPVFFSDPVRVKTEFDNNKYNVVIDLKPFQNDDKKINYNVNGRKLTVFGKSQAKDKDYVQDISFSQDFILPEKSDIAKISKVKENDKLIISIPVKEK